MTDGTIGLVFSRLAIVFVVEGLVNAHTTVVTMLKVFLASHAAKAALGAVVRLVAVRHPQITDGAVVLTKANIAINAMVAVNESGKLA